MLHFIRKQKIKTKSSYLQSINYIDFFPYAKIHNSNLIFSKKDLSFWFCRNNKQMSQNSVQELEIIKKFDLNDVKGFQDLIRQIQLKYNNQLLKNIWIFQNVIIFLKEKKCEKNHSLPYKILLQIYVNLQAKKTIQKMLPQITQLISFNAQKGINLSPIKILLSIHFDTIPQEKQKASQYLEEAYPNNIIEKVQAQEIFFIESKIKKLKLQEAQKLINSAVEILKKNKKFNKFAYYIFKFIQQLCQIYEKQKFNTQQQANKYYQKYYFNYSSLIAQIDTYLTQHQNQLDELQENLIKQKNTSTLLNSINRQKHGLKLQFEKIILKSYLSLAKMLSFFNQHQKLIESFNALEIFFQSFKIQKSFTLIQVYLLTSRSFLILNRKEQALKILKEADQLLFSISDQKLKPQIYLQIFQQFLRVINENQNRQDLYKLQPQKYKTKLIQLSENQETIFKQFQFRQIICKQYQQKKLYQKLQEQLNQMNNRLQQLRQKISKQKELILLMNMKRFKSNLLLHKDQFNKSLEQANKGQILIKLYKSLTQFSNSQSQIINQRNQAFSIFKLTQEFNIIKANNYFNLANFSQKLNQIKQKQLKGLQYLQKAFSYENSSFKILTQNQLINQFRNFQNYLQDVIQKIYRSPQANEKILQFCKNFIKQFSYLIPKAKQAQIDQNRIFYCQISLQNQRIKYQILQALLNKKEENKQQIIQIIQTIQKEIDKITQIIKKIQKIKIKSQKDLYWVLMFQKAKQKLIQQQKNYKHIKKLMSQR